MKLKKIKLLALIAVGSMLAFSPALLAQNSTNTPAPGNTSGTPHGPNIDRFAQALKLNPIQKVKVQTIIADQMQQMQALSQDKSLKVKGPKSKEIRDATMAKMKDVLTPDQFKKYQEMMMNMRSK